MIEINNTNAYVEPIPFWRGEQAFFGRRGFSYLAYTKGSRDDRQSRVDAWQRTYKAQPADIRITIKRPMLELGKWEVYGCLSHFIQSKRDCFFTEQRYCETHGQTAHHIDEIVASLRASGKRWCKEHGDKK